MADERLLGAGCLFPVIQRELEDPGIGLRHRAAMGITEESDAIALVVSEETGAISIAIGGKLERDLENKELRKRLIDLLSNPEAEAEDDEEEEKSDD